MAVTEGAQLVATQIAYANLDVAFYHLSQERKEVTLTDAVMYALNHGQTLGDFGKYYIESTTKNSNGDVIAVKYIKEYEFIDAWKVINPVNDNYRYNDSGLYACILDTGDERILACRGSEPMEKFLTDYQHRKNADQDWIKTNFALLNSIQTQQEAALKKYMTENADLLAEKPWVATGHSLGGALADHAGIISVEEKIGNFSGAINFDGPGHSQEYIDAHMDAINRVSGKLIHKKASIVGDLMFDLPGVKQDYIETKPVNIFNGKEIGISDFIDLLIYYAARKHDTVFWQRSEENGGGTLTKKNGGPSTWEWLLQQISRFIDCLPPAVGNMIPEILLFTIHAVEWTSDLLRDNPDIVKIMIVAVIGLILNNPVVLPIAVSIIAKFIVAITIIIMGPVLVETIIETLKKLTAEIAQGISKTVSWLSEKATDLFEAITEAINGLQEWLRQKNTKGVAYVQGNPYFKADTDKLREYAARLERVNNRLSKLDSNMRSLYWQVGLLDLWDILLANMITSKSYAINQAKKYLYNTADRFENAENKAKNYIGG